MNEDNYTKIKNHIKEITKPEDIANLYNEDFVNWRGPTSPDKERSFYTDYIAKKLLTELDIKELFSDINGSERDSYFVEGHDGVTEKHTKRLEEIFAKSLLGHSLEHLGKLVGYQVPLKASQSDNYGKIDLVSFDDKNSTAYIIELKMADKKETLLRAALEVETYSQIIRKEPLKEFINEKSGRFGISEINDIDDLTVNKAVLFAINDSKLPKELQSENRDRYHNLFKLLHNLIIGVFTIDHHYPTNMHNNPWK